MQSGEVHRLGEEVDRSMPQRPVDGFDRGCAGDHDEVGLRVGPGPEQVEAAPVRQRQVHEHDPRRSFAQLGTSLAQRSSLGHVEALVRNQVCKALAEVEVVLDHERAELVVARPSRTPNELASDGTHERPRTALPDSP